MHVYIYIHICIYAYIYIYIYTPICSTYGTFTYIHHKHQPNVGNTPFPWMVRENHVFVRHALHVSTVLRWRLPLWKKSCWSLWPHPFRCQVRNLPGKKTCFFRFVPDENLSGSTREMPCFSPENKAMVTKGQWWDDDDNPMFCVEGRFLLFVFGVKERYLLGYLAGRYKVGLFDLFRGRNPPSC